MTPIAEGVTRQAGEQKEGSTREARDVRSRGGKKVRQATESRGRRDRHVIPTEEGETRQSDDEAKEGCAPRSTLTAESERQRQAVCS